MQRDILTLMKRHEVPAAIAEEYNDQFQNQFTKGGWILQLFRNKIK